MQYSFSYFQNSIRKFIIPWIGELRSILFGRKKKKNSFSKCILEILRLPVTNVWSETFVKWCVCVCVCIEVVKSVRLQSSHVHTRVWTSKFTETGEDTKPQSGTCEVYFSFDFVLYRGNKNLVKMFIAIEWGEFSRIEWMKFERDMINL